jgi:hypothetical protein
MAHLLLQRKTLSQPLLHIALNHHLFTAFAQHFTVPRECASNWKRPKAMALCEYLETDFAAS